MSNLFGCSRQSEQDRGVWTPLIEEIKHLEDMLCDFDKDESKLVDINIEHIKRIKNAMPSKRTYNWHPKPIRRLLSIQPLNRIEIPLNVLEEFESCGFNVNEYYSESNKKTCLHLAVTNKHYNAVRWLVQHGADCDKESCYYDRTILRCNRRAPIALLATYQDAPLDLFDILRTTGNINGTPSTNAYQYSNSPLPLHVAVMHGHTDIALHLITLGASVNQQDRSRNLPLHLAMKHSHTELALSLIKQGASVNQEDGNKTKPLDIASRDGYTKMAIALIEHGASVNQEDGFGHLPLHLAVSHHHTEIVRVLVDHGASVNQQDGFTWLPLNLAMNMERGHTKLALIGHTWSICEQKK